jgi:hypothetical protein
VSSTARSRRCRARQRAGLVQLLIEVDEAQLHYLLVGAEVLDPGEDQTRQTLARGLEKFLQALTVVEG